MASVHASAAEARFVDAIARRVVELLEGCDSRDGAASAGIRADSRCLTVSQVAACYRVSRQLYAAAPTR